MNRGAAPFCTFSADTTDTTDTTPGLQPPRTGCVGCVRCVGLKDKGKPGRAALVARIVHAVAEALSAPDADLARERAGIVAALPAEAVSASGAHPSPVGAGAVR